LSVHISAQRCDPDTLPVTNLQGEPKGVSMAILAECSVCDKKQRTKKKACPCSVNLDAEKKGKNVKCHIVYRLPTGKQVRRSLSSFETLVCIASTADAAVVICQDPLGFYFSVSVRTARLWSLMALSLNHQYTSSPFMKA
jgi:hypothetical protein